MDTLPTATRVELVRLYYQCGKSATLALRRFNTENQRRKNVCNESTVRRLVSRFEARGSVFDNPRGGRPPVPASTVALVSSCLKETQRMNPNGISSARSVGRKLSLHHSTVNKILKKNLSMLPYKLRVLQELKDSDFPKRMEFADWFRGQMRADVHFLNKILWTDEAHFSLDGSVFTRNCVIWATENPHAFVTSSLHSPRVTVWCGFTAEFILPPIFFENVTINGERYLKILKDTVVPQISQWLDCIYFQQDGAPPHVARTVKTFLEDTFGERVISRNFPNFWPPRSPDLSPVDYWLWGMVKAKVYSHSPTNIEDLKREITRVISEISRHQLRAAVRNLVPRLNAVTLYNGGHFQHML